MRIGVPCNENKDPALRTGVPCNENRFFPVGIDSQGVPCELYRVWVCSLGIYILVFFSMSCNAMWILAKTNWSVYWFFYWLAISLEWFQRFPLKGNRLNWIRQKRNTLKSGDVPNFDLSSNFFLGSQLKKDRTRLTTIS